MLEFAFFSVLGDHKSRTTWMMGSVLFFRKLYQYVVLVEFDFPLLVKKIEGFRCLLCKFFTSYGYAHFTFYHWYFFVKGISNKTINILLVKVLANAKGKFR